MLCRRNRSILGISALFSALCFSSWSAVASEWGYEGDKVAPENWGSVHGSEACGSGLKQSPIDFSQSRLTSRKDRVRLRNLPDLTFDYHPSPVYVENNGHGIKYKYKEGSVVTLKPGGPKYQVLQFHFHSPAEHSFEKGALYEMEMHIVHQSLENPNDLAVVGVMIKQGEFNKVLAPIFDNTASLMNEGDIYADTEEEINIYEALPDDKRYFAYSGSLTTPPCSEGIAWNVIREPIEMSLAQISSFVKVLQSSCCATNGNNRPTQPLNRRRVKLDVFTYSDYFGERDGDDEED